jgi:hypothetical protein
MLNNYSYQAALAASESIHWRVEDIIGGDKRLNFTQPFMPESLANTEPLTFLSREEKRILNQIRGNAYLCIFGLVEEFILPFVLFAKSELAADDAVKRRSALTCGNPRLKTYEALVARMCNVKTTSSRIRLSAAPA